jgi:hypothetical protein
MWDNRARRSDKPGHKDDGDTVLLVSDLGRGIFDETPIRLSGCWAPERGRFGAAEAAKFLDLTLAEIEERARARRMRWPFVVVTEKNTSAEPDERRTFVRYVGELFAFDTGQSVNAEVAAFLAGHPEWSRGTGGTDEVPL